MRDHAEDLIALLDELAWDRELDVMGISYGGPIALTMAGLDRRIRRVILYASSPRMDFSWPWNWLIRSGIVPFFQRWFYRREIGKAEPRYPNLENMYESSSKAEDWEKYREVINHLPEERLESILLEFRMNLDAEKSRVPPELGSDVPVLQIIGDEDQTWGTTWPDEYRRRFPNIKQTLIPGADHKDAVRRAEEFLEAIRREMEADRRRAEQIADG